MNKRLLVWLAHPYGGKPENIGLALDYMRAIQDQYPDDVVIVADWILECQIHNDAVPAQRSAAMSRNFERILKCDELWICGADKEIEASAGIRLEATYMQKLTRPVRRCRVHDEFGIVTTPFAFPV